MGRAQETSPAPPCILNVYVPDTVTAYVRALAAGATAVQEPADRYYGDHSAGAQVVAGNMWWLATGQENLTPDELAARLEAGGKHLPEAQNGG